MGVQSGLLRSACEHCQEIKVITFFAILQKKTGPEDLVLFGEVVLSYVHTRNLTGVQGCGFLNTHFYFSVHTGQAGSSLILTKKIFNKSQLSILKIPKRPQIFCFLFLWFLDFAFLLFYNNRIYLDYFY